MIQPIHSLLAALLLFPLAAQGIIVTTATDEDDGTLGGGTGVSLREAVKYSPSGNLVSFLPGLSGQTVTLSHADGDMSIDRTLTIDATALPSGLTISGNNTHRHFYVEFEKSLTLRGLTLTRGNGIGSGEESDVGGAIYNNGGTLTLAQCTLSSNSAGNSGGAILNVRGSLELTQCTLSGNSAGGDGGAIFNQRGSTLMQCTLSGNSAGFNGGAIFNIGASTLTLCTLSGNSSSFGTGGAISNGSLLTLTNSIVAGNSAPGAPDIYTNQLNFTSDGLNLIGSLANSGLNQQPTFLLAEPKLAPLGDYGGPTHTMPPLLGSPAIDTGGTTTLTTDQRGFPRVSNPDIGAAEYQGASDITRFWPLDFDGDASPYGTEQALGTDPLVSDPANSRNITAPVLNASGHPVLSFGIGAAAPGTSWVLCRSTDLLLFTEIYRFNGSTDTAVPGVTFLRTATGVTVTDTTPPPGGVFYRFEAQFQN